MEIDFQSADPESGFISVPVVPNVHHNLHLFTGSTVISGNPESELTVWDTYSAGYMAKLASQVCTTFDHACDV